MLGEKRLLSCKEGKSVVYIRNSGFQLHMKLLNIILTLLKEGNKPEDIFILGGSVKSSIRKLENVLVEKKIPCYVPTMEKDKIDDRVIDGKIVFSTFHSVKGRQRKFVFVMGFDNNYFEYYAKDMDGKQCPNTLYVGTTRASERLYLIEKDGYPTDKPLEFLKMNHIQMKRQPFIDFQGSLQMVQNIYGQPKNTPPVTVHFITPTELIKFLPDSVMDEIIDLLPKLFTKISQPEDEVKLDIPIVIQTQSGFHEDVSDLNGIAIPSMYTDKIFQELNQDNTENLYNIIEKLLKPGEHPYIRDRFKEASPEIKSVEDYLFLSNIYSALQEKLYYKLSQIGRDEYHWLNEDMIDTCIERLNRVITRERCTPEVEVTIISKEREDEMSEINQVLKPFFSASGKKMRFIFTARVDMVCDDIWELKCTSRLTTEHFLQILIYAWLWRIISPEEQEKKFKLFNIRTGEIYWLEHSELEELTPIVVMLLKSKYEKIKRKTDDEFLETVHKSQQN
jgi:hypothetical protein